MTKNNKAFNFSVLDRFSAYQNIPKPLLQEFVTYIQSGSGGGGDFKSDGTVPMAGNIEMSGAYTLKDLRIPTEDTEAVNKIYVDNLDNSNIKIINGITPINNEVTITGDNINVSTGGARSVETLQNFVTNTVNSVTTLETEVNNINTFITTGVNAADTPLTIADNTISIATATDAQLGVTTLVNDLSDISSTDKSATPSYVNGLVTQSLIGLSSLEAGIICATGDKPLSGLQTIQGYTLKENDRVLLVGQANKAENGVYAASANAWSRASDADTAEKIHLAMINITGGNEQGLYIFTQSANIVLDTDDIVIVKAFTSKNSSAWNAATNYSKAEIVSYQDEPDSTLCC